MTTWSKVSEERYTEMLEVLPPEVWAGLFGEPHDHTDDGYPRFAALAKIDGQHYKASEPMTRLQFHALAPQDVLDNVERDGETGEP